MSGHSQDMGSPHIPRGDETMTSTDQAGGASVPDFGTLYEEHFDYVWRTVRRLGVIEASVDDVVQDVFVVVHRRLPTFEGRSKLKTWLYGVMRRVVSDYHRSRSRRHPNAPIEEPIEDVQALGPEGEAQRSEAHILLHRLLDRLDQPKREVFVLAELEQMTAPEIAEGLGVPLNTVYSRLRAARASFNEGVARLQAERRRRGV